MASELQFTVDPAWVQTLNAERRDPLLRNLFADWLDDRGRDEDAAAMRELAGLLPGPEELVLGEQWILEGPPDENSRLRLRANEQQSTGPWGLSIAGQHAERFGPHMPDHAELAGEVTTVFGLIKKQAPCLLRAGKWLTVLSFLLLEVRCEPQWRRMVEGGILAASDEDRRREELRCREQLLLGRRPPEDPSLLIMGVPLRAAIYAEKSSLHSGW